MSHCGIGERVRSDVVGGLVDDDNDICLFVLHLAVHKKMIYRKWDHVEADSIAIHSYVHSIVDLDVHLLVQMSRCYEYAVVRVLGRQECPSVNPSLTAIGLHAEINDRKI